MKRAIAVLAVGLLGAAGCSSSAGNPQKNSSTTASQSGSAGELKGSLTVYAAASLTEAFNTLKGQFSKAHPGVSIAVTYGASSDLSTQITQGAPVDVFASASTKNMAAVVSAGDASTPVDFVSNTLEIATPPSNPGKVHTLQNLARPGVKVAVCDPAVPCGAVATTVFANAEITVKPKASLADVKSTLAAVESGEVDAGMVYVTDVRAAGKKVSGIQIPSAVNASTKYPIAATKHAKNPALAKAFVDFVLSPAGKKVLAADGFSKP